jgi:hypothetical protein
MVPRAKNWRRERRRGMGRGRRRGWGKGGGEGRRQGGSEGGGRAAGRVGAAARVGNGARGGGGDCARATGGWVIAFSAGRMAGNQPIEQMIDSSWSSRAGYRSEQAVEPSPPPSSTSSSHHPPDLSRPDLLEVLAHVPGVTSLLRPAMAASRRGDLLRSWRSRPSSPPHPNASLPPLSGFARSPTRRPPARTMAAAATSFSQPWPRPPRPPSRPSSSSAAGGPWRLLLSFPTFSPLIPASGGLPAQRTATRAAAAMAEDLARGGARRGWWPGPGGQRRALSLSLSLPPSRSSSSLSCPTAAPPRRPHVRELRRRREQVC